MTDEEFVSLQMPVEDFANCAMEAGFTQEQAEFMWTYLRYCIRDLYKRVSDLEWENE